jgi:hypothetical protein
MVQKWLLFEKGVPNQRYINPGNPATPSDSDVGSINFPIGKWHPIGMGNIPQRRRWMAAQTTNLVAGRTPRFVQLPEMGLINFPCFFLPTNPSATYAKWRSQ